MKEIDPEIQVVLHVADLQTTVLMNTYFDALEKAGVKWDVIGLSAYPQISGLKTSVLIRRAVDNVKSLKERYGKPVMVVETGHYNDQPLESNHFLCDLLQQLIEAGASGCFYWEPELTDDYTLGAWNPKTRRVSIALEAFNGLKHTEVPYVMDIAWKIPADTVFETAPIELPVTARHIRDRIEKVELMEGKQVQATSTEPPYTLKWTEAEPGQHSIYALATATDGETASTDTVKVMVSSDILLSVNAVQASNDIHLKADKSRVAVESSTPLRHLRVFSINGMLLAEKKVNGTFHASLPISTKQKGSLLLVQVETDQGTKTFHIRM